MNRKFLILMISFIMSFFMLCSCDIGGSNGESKSANISSTTNDDISNSILTNTSDADYSTTNDKTYFVLRVNADNCNNKAGRVSSYYQSVVEGEEVMITATTNQGYTFDGWYDGEELLMLEETYKFTMPAKNLLYTAKWHANTNTKYKVEHYLQDIRDNNYSLYEIDNLTGTTNTLISEEKAKKYEGFSLVSPHSQIIDGSGLTVLKLYYTRNLYTVTLNRSSNNGGIVSGAGAYRYGEKIRISTTINPGSTFIGWYKDNALYTQNEYFDFVIGSSNVTFEAKYIVNKYTLTINNEVDGMTLAAIIDGNEYNYNSSVSTSLFESNSPITLLAKNISSGYTLKWTIGDGVIHFGDSYKFDMPADDLTISITARPYLREEDIIYFGKYPQTKVIDNALITELNSLAGTKPTLSNNYNWTDYNYYIYGNITSYMYYQDIDYDNDGLYDYRGVYFTSYRPYYYSKSSSASNSHQDDNGYYINTIYWFSYDPIEWVILTEENEKVLVLANLLLDSQFYYPLELDKEFNHNGSIGFVNNYELSDIRRWLNDSFYNTAFDDLQKTLIETTIVDNSADSMENLSSTANPRIYEIFASNNTNDKMFLLSNMEVVVNFKLYFKDFIEQSNRTDYAKCQGIYDSNSWFFRSAGWHERYGAEVTGFSGGSITTTHCYFLSGIRPACWINL